MYIYIIGGITPVYWITIIAWTGKCIYLCSLPEPKGLTFFMNTPRPLFREGKIGLMFGMGSGDCPFPYIHPVYTAFYHSIDLKPGKKMLLTGFDKMYFDLFKAFDYFLTVFSL